jgi:hypothetical protein
MVAASMLSALLGMTISGQSRNQNKPGRAKLQPLNIKTGLWEATVTYKRSGELPLPPGTLEKLLPEQRARLEERMKGNSGESNTRSYRSCLKKEDLENPDFTDKKQCTWTTLELTSTTAKGSAVCEYREIGARLSGTAEIIAVDEKHIKGTIRMTAPGTSKRIVADGTLTAKWLGSSCGSVK